MAKRRQWSTGDTCKYEGCPKVLRYSTDNLPNSTVGEGIVGMCSVHHRQCIEDGTVKPTKIVIDWSKTHYCIECGTELCRRSTKKTDRAGRNIIGSMESVGRYICRKCNETAKRRAEGMVPMNRANKSEDGSRQQCNACLEWKDTEENFRTTKYGFRTHCKECDKKRALEYNKNNPDRHRKTHTITRYNVDYDELLLTQNNVCALCSKTPEQNALDTDNRHRYLSVDHDHTCCNKSTGVCGECVRGLLCHTCNMMLGLMEDDLDQIEKLFGGSSWGSSATKYLQR